VPRWRNSFIYHCDNPFIKVGYWAIITKGQMGHLNCDGNLVKIIKCGNAIPNEYHLIHIRTYAHLETGTYISFQHIKPPCSMLHISNKASHITHLNKLSRGLVRPKNNNSNNLVTWDFKYCFSWNTPKKLDWQVGNTMMSIFLIVVSTASQAQW